MNTKKEEANKFLEEMRNEEVGEDDLFYNAFSIVPKKLSIYRAHFIPGFIAVFFFYLAIVDQNILKEVTPVEIILITIILFIAIFMGIHLYHLWDFLKYGSMSLFIDVNNSINVVRGNVLVSTLEEVEEIIIREPYPYEYGEFMGKYFLIVEGINKDEFHVKYAISPVLKFQGKEIVMKKPEKTHILKGENLIFPRIKYIDVDL